MRIAIVALNGYPAVNPEAGAAIGGLETFAWSLARALAKESTDSVHFIVRHTSRPAKSPVENVSILCDLEPLRLVRLDFAHSVDCIHSFPWLRVKRFHPRLLWQLPVLAIARLLGPQLPMELRIRRLLEEARPDVVLSLGAGDGTAATVRASRVLGVPSWVWWQSNADLNERFLSDDSYVDLYGVTSSEARESYRATRLICQTHEQQARVTKLLNRESVVIPNPIDCDRFHCGSKKWHDRQGVLWIGRYDRHHKRPLLALQIARLCPEISFHLVINRGDPDVEREVRMTCPPNVRLTDYIPRDEISAEFQRSRLFLSTGSPDYEGFPNVLLEAAASGTPIVSLEDFDGFLSRSQAGESAAGHLEQLVITIRTMWSNAEVWMRHSLAGDEFVRNQHTLKECVRKFREVVDLDV